MSQTVGVAYPERLPDQPEFPDYCLFQSRIRGVTGTANNSPTSGAVDPVSNDWLTGAIDSTCMGLTDAAAGDVPTVLMFNVNRGFRAPGCVGRETDDIPYSCG